MNLKSLLSSFFLLFVLTNMYSQTTVVDSFLYGGISRDYRIYIPSVYNGINPVPLVFNLHGYGSVNSAQEVYGDFRPIADTANFIIVAPNGSFDGSNKRFWNTFGGSSVDDIGFISALIDTVSAYYNIDTTRIYSTGMSNGGFMSYQLACFLGNRITAIASVTGTMTHFYFGTCTPPKPTPVMQIHGTLDATVPYVGNLAFVHVDTLVNFWVNFNNCSPTPIYNLLPDIVPTDGCVAEHYAYQNGTNNSSVELYKIIGGGHSWPGAPVNINITNMDFSASKEIWRFFSQYKLDQLNNINIKIQPNTIRVFPNPSNNTFSVWFNNNETRNINVYNTLGMLVYSISTNDQQITIELEEKGVYFLLPDYNHRAIKMVKQ
ncbi:MAG: T9SS type A sorting domain-containing protein [Flavobacteriales bacterium]|nr:T9SS type A sorting domain-containing protein [Flavobacteriales bacterium]